MSTSMPKSGPAYYTVRQAAWLLGIDRARVSRAVRLGTLRTVRRYGRPMVPASALVQLLGERVDDGAESRGAP